MRQLFLDKGMVVLKKVCEPLLDDYSVLIFVHYSCMSSCTEFTKQEQLSSLFISSIPNKVKKIFESLSNNGLESIVSLIKNSMSGEIKSFGQAVSGKVIAVGSKVKNIRAGDLVACAGSEFAKHADIVCVPERFVVKISNAAYLKQASLTTIGARALHGVRRVQPQLGEIVCVLGQGLLGQLTIQLAKLSGCTVIAIGNFEERLKIAQESGADYVFLAHEQQTLKEIQLITKNHGVDTAFVTASSTNDAMIPLAVQITRRNGKVVFVNDGAVEINREQVYAKEIDLLVSHAYGSGQYDALQMSANQDYPLADIRWTENRNLQAFVQLMEQQKIKLDHLITEEVPIEQAANAYERIKKRTSLAVILSYTCSDAQKDMPKEQSCEVASKNTDFRFKPAIDATLKVGFVGAGDFAKEKLMPVVSKLEKVKINAIVDADAVLSLKFSKIYKGAVALTNDDDLFKNELVDVVMITSPDKFHCDQALKALQQGKAVFMEKPMVTDNTQLNRMMQYLKSNAQAPFCVDYNRSFAPYIQKVKSAISKRNTPLMIQYRVNVGEMKKNLIHQTKGRIIGESCYIMDIFCYLTESKPIAVSVDALHAPQDNVFPTDNFVTTVTFTDGSICSLIYTSLGHPHHGVERMELFFDSKSIIMQDYAQLHGFGFPNIFNETTMFPNRGYENLIQNFFNAIRKPVYEPPISFERFETVAQLALIIDSLACEGGGSKEIK